MTMEAIDAFEITASPTPEQVGFVWNQHPAPSGRVIGELLRRRGAKISDRSVARWKKNGWAQTADGKGKATISEAQHVPGAVRQELRGALKDVPEAVITDAAAIAAAGGIEGAVVGGKLTDEDYARIEKGRTELMKKTQPELLAEQAKERIVMNILLMREAARRAHIMVLIPKETGAFVESMTDADKAASHTPVIEATTGGNGDDAKVIEGTVNAPLSPFSQALRAFREKVA